MSEAFCCDRCRLFFHGNADDIEHERPIIHIVVDRDGDGETADLCPACVADMDLAWHNVETHGS